MKVCILAGGYGSRLQEETVARPKPLVEIGGRPILWHIMSLYAAHGFNEFVVALGYRGEMIKRYFLDYRCLRNDLTVDLGRGQFQVHDGACEDWTIHLADTGLDTATGGRVLRLAPWVGRETFMLTYGDGVADINVPQLLACHRAHGKVATVTAVHPPARFGHMALSEDQVAQFTEKSQLGEGWINGGFFVFEPSIFDWIAGDQITLEREPLERLAAAGQLVAYRHTGFWQCMDTLRDVRLLEGLWQEGRARWKIWA